MRIETKDLGLAAYIKMQGGVLVAQTNRTFVFETTDDRGVEAWTIEYSNSCCHRHDRELMDLRNLLNTNRR